MRRRLERQALLAAALPALACGSPGASGTATEPPRAEPESIAASADTSPPAAEGAAAPPASPVQMEPAAEVARAEVVSPSTFDLDAWAEQHGLEISLEADRCEPAGLGEKPAEVIWCLHRQDRAEGVVLHLRALYAARAKKLVKLLEIPYAASRVALVDGSKSDGETWLVKLDSSTGADGRSVELTESGGLDCASANQKNRDQNEVSPNTFKSVDAAIKLVCKARGRYRWAGGTLRRGG